MMVGVASTTAQEVPVDADQPAPAVEAAGRYLVLKSPIDDRTVTRVKNTVQELRQAATPDRKPALVLEIPGGVSQYHNVYPLAEFLASPAAADVQTVAWLPKSVTGYNAILPLACDEIVMHPEAELGDIGRGQPLKDNRQAFVREIVRSQTNRLVSEAIAEAMMDQSVALLRVQIEPEPGATETRILTRAALEELRAADAVVTDVETIKRRGQPGVFTGADAREAGILVSRLGFAGGEVAAVYGLTQTDFSDARPADDPVQASLIKVEGTIDPLLESFLERQIDRVVAAGDDLLIFRVESRTGESFVSIQLADRIAALADRDIRTVAWIPKHATGPAAIIAMACDEIYMAPGAKLGGVIADAEVDNVGMSVESLRDLARAKGRSQALAAAMADNRETVYEATDVTSGTTVYLDQTELHAQPGAYIQGRAIDGTGDGKLLTLTTDRAAELKLITASAPDLDTVQGIVGVPVDRPIAAVGKTWVDSLVFFLNNPVVMGGLLFLGIFLVYLELHFMSGVLAIAAGLCFALFFWARVLGGTAGSLEVMLFIIGLGLIGMEVFVVPGFGVCGVSGVLLVVGSLVLASQTFQGISTGESVARAGKTIAQLGGAMTAVVIFAALVGRFLPKIPIFRDLVLAPPPAESGVRLRPDLQAASPLGIAVGDQGKAITTLRPAGKARLGEDLIDVISEGPYIEPSTPIEVVEIAGNRIVVREV